MKVYVLNHRDVYGILRMIRSLDRIVDAPDKANALADGFEKKIAATRAQTSLWKVKPTVYFQEWY